MQRITPHLWFDKEAPEAADLYASTFPGARIKHQTTIHATPSGSVDIVTVQLLNLELTLFNAGPLFKFTPAASFLVACESKEEVDRLWGILSEGGSALMELGEYPFAERYGWTQDRYGLSWQLMVAAGDDAASSITPMLLFTGKVCGKAEKAMKFYVSVFRDARLGDIVRYGRDEQPDQPGNVKFGSFTLDGQRFAAMESAHAHDFTFNEAFSFVVNCETQEEIDYYWDRLSADPKAEQCGWVKDAYGLSWQIVPAEMEAMLRDGDEAQKTRVTEAFLAMKKFDLAKLREAYAG